MSIQFEIEKFQSERFEHRLGNYWVRVSSQIQTINRFIYLEWASARIIAGWVPAAKTLEWKCLMTKFMWQNMSFASHLRTRKEELSGSDKISIPSERLQMCLQDISRADSYYSFLAGWFLELTKQLIQEYESFQERLDPIFDAPTLEILPDIISKKREQVAWANRLVHHSVHDVQVLEDVETWRAYTRSCLLHIGGLAEKTGDSHAESKSSEEVGAVLPPKRPDLEAYGPAPKKRTMPDWLVKGDFNEPPAEVRENLKIFMWHYMTEIQVVDPMCYVFFGVDNMPFEFYCDFSRHIWDETRHHQMGVRRLEQLGFDIRKFPIPYTEDAVSELENYYAELTMIGETCSFSRKKKSMDSFYGKGDVISGMTAEIDIVDERSHVRFGKKWIPVLYQQRYNDKRSLDEIVQSLLNRWMEQDESGLGRLQGNPELSKLTPEERQSLTHFAFCGKIEFKNLVFDKL